MKNVILGDIPTMIWTGKFPDAKQMYRHPTLTFVKFDIDD
jgi:hypothetical protein